MSEESYVEIPVSGGVDVFVPRIAVQALLMDLARKNPRPMAPVQNVKFGNTTVQERNYTHPGYLRALAEWDAEIQAIAGEYILRETAEINIERITDEDRAKIAHIKEKMGDLISSDQPDEMIWLRYVACRSNEDLGAIIRTARTGEPSEEGIEAYRASFRR